MDLSERLDHARKMAPDREATVLESIRELANREPKPDLGLRADGKPIRGVYYDTPKSDSLPFFRGLRLPPCKESSTLLEEETLRQKMLSAAGIVECAHCSGSGSIYVNLSDYISAGRAGVNCPACSGTGVDPDPNSPF